MKILRKGPIQLFLFIILFMLPASAYANMTQEYYTYGGFGPVTSALQKVGLIFGDNAYQGLFAVAAVLGLFVGGMMFFMKSLMGAKASYGSWAITVIAGITIYLALVVPKGSLVVYDPVMNQTQTIGSIPDGVVLIAGLLNKIERGLVDIVSNASDPVGYQGNAGGTNFDILNNISSKGVLLADQYMNASLKNYITDCVFFELQRPGTTLTINDLASNMDFLPLFSQANSPAIYTTFYDNTAPNGNALSCKDAWSNIQTVLNNPASFTSNINARCADAGYDPTIPSELVSCQNAISNTTTWLESASVAATDLFRQTLIAQSISDAATSASPDTAMQILASRNAGTSMIATAAMANQWLPIIRAVMTAVAFCLIPLLALFVPTPIFPKALSTVVGFFLWITVWGIIDAILHQFAIDYARTVYTEVKQYQLGVTAVMNFSTASMKTLAAFATIRWAGLMLATALVGLLVKFGGSALTSLAGSMTGHAQSAGERAGHQIITPEGKAQTLGSLENAPSVMANAHRWGFNERSGARTFEGMSKMGTSIQEQQMLGGGQFAADRASSVNAGDRAGHIQASERNAAALGLGNGASAVASLKRLQENGLTDEVSSAAANRALGSKDGKGPIGAGWSVAWGAGDNGKLMVKSAISQDGLSSVKVANGMVTESGTMSGSQILSKADALMKQGHPEAALGLQKMVSPKAGGSAGPGRGILDNEVMKYEETRSFDGKHGMFRSEHGAAVEWKDTSRDDQYRKEDHLNELKDGRSATHYNVDKYDYGRGDTYEHGSALYGAVSKDRALVDRFMNAKDEKGRLAAGQAFSAAYARDLSSFTQQTADGSSSWNNQASLGANANAGVGSGKLGVGVNLSGSSSVVSQDAKSERDNITSREMLNTMYNARDEAEKKGFSGDAAKDYVLGKVSGKAVDDTIGYLKRTHDSSDRGAGKAVHAAGEVIAGTGEKMEDFRESIKDKVSGFFGIKG